MLDFVGWVVDVYKGFFVFYKGLFDEGFNGY